jgi:peptidoglycan/xylan/chitin deacetylase (PgdA/CDA1 family)
MYHRVAEPAVDPWGLSVRPDRFEEHLIVLRRMRRPFPMSEFVDRLECHTLPREAVAITFDDGYVDTLREAKPRAQARDVPATVFVTTGSIGQRTEYWWDELARGILLRKSALDCEAMLAGQPYRLVLPRVDRPVHELLWRAWEQPRTGRESLYLEMWRRLRTLSAVDRDTAMHQLRVLLELSPAEAGDLPMTGSELAALTADGLFEIGGHTVSHPVLPALDPAERRREILEGKGACERLVGRSISGFAYPHGAMDADVRLAVRECGFVWACSTESRAVSGRLYDRYALPRLAVDDSSGCVFERALHEVSS